MQYLDSRIKLFRTPYRCQKKYSTRPLEQIEYWLLDTQRPVARAPSLEML